MLETVNTCMTSVYICITPIDYLRKFSSMPDCLIMFAFQCDAPEGKRTRYTLPLSFVCEREDEEEEEVRLFISSPSANGNTTGIFISFVFLFSSYIYLSIWGMPSYVRMYVCASAISSSFNYKVNEILDDFSL